MDIVKILKEGSRIELDFQGQLDAVTDFPGGTVLCYIHRNLNRTELGGDEIQIRFVGTPGNMGSVIAVVLKHRASSILELRYLMLEPTERNSVAAKFSDYDRFTTLWYSLIHVP